jgi:hypothetical protein
MINFNISIIFLNLIFTLAFASSVKIRAVGKLSEIYTIVSLISILWSFYMMFINFHWWFVLAILIAYLLAEILVRITFNMTSIPQSVLRDYQHADEQLLRDIQLQFWLGKYQNIFLTLSAIFFGVSIYISYF